MNIGEYLTKARKLKGMSQEDVANSLGVSRQSVSLWECDQTVPSFDNLISLSELYNVNVSVLIGQEDFNNQIVTKNEVNKIDDSIKNKKYKLFLKLAIIFTSISALLFILPGISTIVIGAGIVFSVISMKYEKTNGNLMTLIFSISFFMASIFVYANLGKIYELVLL